MTAALATHHSTASRRPDLPGLMSRHAMLVAATLLFAAFAATSSVFATPGNAVNIMRQSASVLVLGVAMALVVLVGGIDLSVGSVVLASATFCGVGLAQHFPPPVAVAMGIGIGLTVGALNAALVEGLKISPVIATLGTMIAVRGFALIVLGYYNSWVEIGGPVFNDLASRTVLGVPLDALTALAVTLVVGFVLRFTVFGRALHAVGDAPVAARLTGLRIPLLRSWAYVGCGGLAGLAGVLVAARTGLISPSVGEGLEFFAIAVVALGAGGLPAGRVTVGNALTGTIILMMVFNYMTIRGVPGTWQTTVTGLLLLAAMVAGRLVQRDMQSEASAGGAFRDEYAHMTPGGAQLVRATIAASTLLLALVFVFVNPRFATAANLIALVEQNTTLAIVAVGATIGIVSRAIDISPGSVIAFGAVVAALVNQMGIAMPVALLAGVLACAAVYALNGAVVGGLGLDPLIVTLAAWIWARGLAVSLTGATTITFDTGFVTTMNTNILGFTPDVAIMFAAFALGWLILRRSPLGIRIYAMGSDPRMLRQAGVNDRRLRAVILIIMSIFTATGMIVVLGRLGAAAPMAGFGLELDAIVAVIIGGASFRGGTGRLRDTLIGVLFLAILNNGLSGLQMGDAQFDLIKGIAILLALTLRAVTQWHFSRRAAQ